MHLPILLLHPLPQLELRLLLLLLVAILHIDHLLRNRNHLLEVLNGVTVLLLEIPEFTRQTVERLSILHNYTSLILNILKSHYFEITILILIFLLDQLHSKHLSGIPRSSPGRRKRRRSLITISLPSRRRQRRSNIIIIIISLRIRSLRYDRPPLQQPQLPGSLQNSHIAELELVLGLNKPHPVPPHGHQHLLNTHHLRALHLRHQKTRVHQAKSPRSSNPRGAMHNSRTLLRLQTARLPHSCQEF